MSVVVGVIGQKFIETGWDGSELFLKQEGVVRFPLKVLGVGQNYLGQGGIRTLSKVDDTGLNLL